MENGDGFFEGTMRQVFRFGTDYVKFGICLGTLFLTGFICLCCVLMLPRILNGDFDHIDGAAIMIGGPTLMLTVIFYYGRQTLRARIETEGETILYLSGGRRVEGSLKEVAELKTFSTDAGYDYRIVFRDGRRIDFNSSIENAEILRRYVERGSGQSFFRE